MSNVSRATKAKGRNQFLVYDDLKENIDLLTDEQAGKIFKAMLQYRWHLKEPDNYAEPAAFDELALKLVYNPIRGHLQRDWLAYTEACTRKADNKKQEESADNDDEGGG